MVTEPLRDKLLKASKKHANRSVEMASYLVKFEAAAAKLGADVEEYVKDVPRFVVSSQVYDVRLVSPIRDPIRKQVAMGTITYGGIQLTLVPEARRVTSVKDIRLLSVRFSNTAKIIFFKDECVYFDESGRWLLQDGDNNEWYTNKEYRELQTMDLELFLEKLFAF